MLKVNTYILFGLAADVRKARADGHGLIYGQIGEGNGRGRAAERQRKTEIEMRGEGEKKTERERFYYFIFFTHIYIHTHRETIVHSLNGAEGGALLVQQIHIEIGDILWHSGLVEELEVFHVGGEDLELRDSEHLCEEMRK